MLPADKGRAVMDSLTCVVEPGEEAYLSDLIMWCDNTPDSKV